MTTRKTVLLTLAFSLAALVLHATRLSAQIVGFSGQTEDPNVTIHMTCQANPDSEPRCALVHAYKGGTPDEEWTMGAGDMEMVGENPPTFCFTADVTEQGDDTGGLGPFPPIMGKRACFEYRDGSAWLYHNGGLLELVPNPALAEGVKDAQKKDTSSWRKT